MRNLGFDTMRFSNKEVSDAVNIISAAVSALAAFWKNNSFTFAALEADRVLKELVKQ